MLGHNSCVWPASPGLGLLCNLPGPVRRADVAHVICLARGSLQLRPSVLAPGKGSWTHSNGMRPSHDSRYAANLRSACTSGTCWLCQGDEQCILLVLEQVKL